MDIDARASQVNEGWRRHSQTLTRLYAAYGPSEEARVLLHKAIDVWDAERRAIWEQD